MTSTDEVRALSTDVRGRVLMPAEQRQQILAAFERSGMTGVAFANHVGVKYATFAGWLRHERLARAERPAGKRAKGVRPPVRFIEARMPAAAPSGLELELPGGVRLRVTDSSQVTLAAELLRLLRPC